MDADRFWVDRSRCSRGSASVSSPSSLPTWVTTDAGRPGSTADSGHVICPVCHDRIGVYERIVAVTAAGARETSRAQDPWLEDRTPPSCTPGVAAPRQRSTHASRDQPRAPRARVTLWARARALERLRAPREGYRSRGALAGASDATDETGGHHFTFVSSAVSLSACTELSPNMTPP